MYGTDALGGERERLSLRQWLVSLTMLLEQSRLAKRLLNTASPSFVNETQSGSSRTALQNGKSNHGQSRPYGVPHHVQVDKRRLLSGTRSQKYCVD